MVYRLHRGDRRRGMLFVGRGLMSWVDLAVPDHTPVAASELATAGLNLIPGRSRLLFADIAIAGALGALDYNRLGHDAPAAPAEFTRVTRRRMLALAVGAAVTKTPPAPGVSLGEAPPARVQGWTRAESVQRACRPQVKIKPHPPTASPQQRTLPARTLRALPWGPQQRQSGRH